MKINTVNLSKIFYLNFISPGGPHKRPIILIEMLVTYCSICSYLLKKMLIFFLLFSFLQKIRASHYDKTTNIRWIGHQICLKMTKKYQHPYQNQNKTLQENVLPHL